MSFFGWDLPMAPDDPFGNSLLVVLDSVRVLIILLALASFILLIPSLQMARNLPTRYRLICLMLFSVYIGLTEFMRIGYYAHYRLILAVFTAALTFVSTLLYIQYEGDRRYAPHWAQWVADHLHVLPRNGREDTEDREHREAGEIKKDFEDGQRA